MTSGQIVLVGTPIGNLSDLSPGAVDALRGADVIACEDTRRTRALLSHAGVPTPRLVVLNERTETKAIEGLVRRAGDGKSVVVVSDAGMPGVSDPGERLVAAAIDAGVSVRAVPGPSATRQATGRPRPPAAR